MGVVVYVLGDQGRRLQSHGEVEVHEGLVCVVISSMDGLVLEGDVHEELIIVVESHCSWVRSWEHVASSKLEDTRGSCVDHELKVVGCEGTVLEESSVSVGFGDVENQAVIFPRQSHL